MERTGGIGNMVKKKPEQKAIKLPYIKCKFCGEKLEPTEDSIRRILHRGVKNSAPFYICECTPSELQVYPGWHKTQLSPK